MKLADISALIVVDVQNDFCPGGSLPVNGGDEIVPIINALIPRFQYVAFTRDWHPADHYSFAENPEFVDGSWPVHCVAHSTGAEFHGSLHIPVDAPIFSKGEDKNVDTYSGFEDGTLNEALKKRGVQFVFVCGLATDYCVRATALDGVKLGFEVVLFIDACRAVDHPRDSGEDAMIEMSEAGVMLCRARDIPRDFLG